ncbi:MAG: hypothetical protein IPH12_09025 [Saprospirales bacterium]|nr:hypothetical protein [Saprospirales bacterium]MBK8920977.1 hypothetical protein [Saprospirales bacterium]
MFFKRIHIFGAPGSGVTTLGRALAQRLEYACFDTDDYYWYTTDSLPYRRKRNPEHRLRLLRQDIEGAEQYIVCGALLGWGDSLLERFDAVVYRWLPATMREARIRSRETARYGSGRLAIGGDLHGVLEKFITWAKAYDSESLNRRSRAAETAWLQQSKIPTLLLTEDMPLEELLSAIEAFARQA